MEAFDANSEDVVYEFVGLLLVNYSSREHCVVIHAKKQNFSVKSRALSLSDAVRTHFMMYSVRSQPPKRRWRDAECNFRRWALCATRPSCVPKRTECNFRRWALCATRPSCVPKRTIWVSMCLSSTATGFSSRTMVGSASCVKLAHIHHCAWQRSPAPCCEAPFTGPFSGDHRKHVPTLVLSFCLNNFNKFLNRDMSATG